MTNTRRLLDRPILILGCNRSGTTLLFRNLAEHPLTWSLYEEAQDLYYRHFPIHPEAGDRLIDPPSDDVGPALHQAFYRAAHNKEFFTDRTILRLVPRKFLQRQINFLYKRPPIRLVDKTPANSLRVPFLARLFPDARFIFLVRRAEDVISSLMEGWTNWSGTGKGAWRYTQWHYIVPPGWQHQRHKTLAEICAFQWVESSRTAWEDLQHCCPDRWLLVRHEDAVRSPRDAYRRILEFSDLPCSPFFDRLIARSATRVFTHGGSAPRPDKWRESHEHEIESVRPLFEPLMCQFYGD